MGNDHSRNQALKRSVETLQQARQRHKTFCELVQRNDINGVRALVTQTPNVDFTDVDYSQSTFEHYTPLYFAILNNYVEIAEILLTHGANPNRSGSLNAYQRLEKVMRDALSKTNTTYCFWDDNIQELLITTPQRVILPLHMACHTYRSHKNLELIEVLLRNRADVSLAGWNRETAIFHADKPEVVNLLLDYGAEVNHQDKWGATVLHKAVRLERNDCIRVQLQRGVDLQLCDALGLSPILYTIRVGNVRALEIILKYREVDLDAHLAASRRFMLKYVNCRHGTNEKCRRFEILFTLSSYGADIGLLFKETRNWLGLRKKYRPMGTCPPPEKIFLLKHIFEGTENPPCMHPIVPEFELELAMLKSIAICVFPRVTLYDVLFFKARRMAKYCINENMVKLYMECDEDFGTRFRHYGFMLNFKMRKGLCRRELVEEAYDSLEWMMGDRLPEHCSEKIFRYFSDDQLKDFNEPLPVTEKRRLFFGWAYKKTSSSKMTNY